MDDFVITFLERWVDERRTSLRADQPQDVAVSEIVRELPELAAEDPVGLGLRLLAVALRLDTGEARAALVVDLGDAPGGLETPEPPAEWSIRPEPRQVQLHLTPPDAGSDRPVDVRHVRLGWRQPSGFDGALTMTYTVSRPLGPEFDDWEPVAALTIMPAPSTARPPGTSR